jgi:hypothetical protein
LKQKSLRTQVNYSKIGIDKNQLSVNSRENSRTFPKIRGTALVTLNKVGGNPVSYNTEAVIWYKHTLSFVHVGTILHHLVDSL